MALFKGLAGFAYDKDSVLSVSNIKYQGYFRKVNSGSSISKWNTVRTVSSAGYYSINLGDGDWLGQNGSVSVGDEVYITFWKPTASGRNDHDLTEWGVLKITLTSSNNYINNVQTKENQTPVVVSMDVPTTGLINNSQTATNSSHDDHSWDFNGVTMRQIGYAGSEMINSISRIEESVFDWGDTTSDTYSGSSNGTHTWTSVGDFTVGLTVTDYSGASDTGSDTIRIKYRTPTTGLSWAPLTPTIQETPTFTPNISDIDNRVTGVDYKIDGTTIYSNQSKTFSFQYQFTVKAPHTVTQVIKWNDGFDDKTLQQTWDITIKNIPPEASFTTEQLIYDNINEGTQSVLVDATSTSVDIDGTLSNYYWKIRSISGPNSGIILLEAEGDDLREMPYLIDNDRDGVYEYTHQVWDEDGEYDIAQAVISVGVIDAPTILGAANSRIPTPSILSATENESSTPIPGIIDITGND